MARRGPKKGEPRLPGDPADPRGMAAHVASFLEWITVKGYAERTIRDARFTIGYFITWCEQRGITRPSEVTRPVLIRYQRYLYHYRSEDGRPLSFRSQHCRLTPLRGFFKWLAQNNLTLYNPAADLELPRVEKRLPRFVLTASEAEGVINRADTTHKLGVRDRAVLETLYSTGIRRMELIRLKLYDLDVERGTLMVRQGKMRKDRMIPIGERALGWVEKYLADVRPALVVEPDDGTLFLTASGEPFSGNRLSQLVKEYVDGANVGKKGACHLFRHTMATLMLEGGADIRFIQQMLGHAEISTTQIYTQVSIKKLKEIHTATHPAKMTRETAYRTTVDDDAPVAAAPDEATPATQRATIPPARIPTPQGRAALALVLAAEVDEDE